MNKNFIITALCICLPCLSNHIFAQDKIISTTGDTINCKILNISKRNICYTKPNSIQNTVINKDKRYIESWIISKDNDIFNSANRWRFSINSGYGVRTASTKDAKNEMSALGFSKGNIDSYFRDLIFGIKGSGQIHYLFCPNHGLGLDYQFMHTKSNVSEELTIKNHHGLVNIEEVIYMNYIGSSYYHYSWLNNNKKSKLFFQLSMGISMYRDEVYLINQRFLITGSSFGTNCELGYEYYLTKHTSINLKSAFFLSSLSKIKIQTGYSETTQKLDKKDKENLSRIELGVGFNIYL